MKSIVSFIVPAYNVEQYIEECIKSIQQQTYNNIEIIVVDDGSTDKTPQIVDDIAVKDPRVHIIHKKNAGVSEARNSGLEFANGEYVAFVDGDDYISPGYTDYMLGLITKDDCDYALSVNCYMSQKENQTKIDVIKILSAEEATILLLSPRVIVGCWNKLYKKRIIDESGLRFNSQLFYGEGLRFITQFAQLSRKVAVGYKKVYYYRRNNYASVCTRFNMDNFYNGYKSLATIESDLKYNTPQVFNMLLFHRCMFRAGALARIISAGVRSEYEDYYKESIRFIRSNLLKCLCVKNVSLYKKGILIGSSISPWLMSRLDDIRRKRIQQKSV